jgi:hypothetical protein
VTDDNSRPTEAGFELHGVFYRWHLSDNGKDLMLIDRFTGMPTTEFFQLVEDNFDRGRAPVVLAMIATSIRNHHPEWTVERITRKVMDMNLTDVTFIDGEEEEDPRPPDGAASEAAATADSKPAPDGFSQSLTPEGTSRTSETLSAIPV